MRGGDVVTYVDGAGAVFRAAVCGVPDTGASGAKVLNLRFADGRVLEGIAHEQDRAPGGAYWTFEPPPISGEPMLGAPPTGDSPFVVGTSEPIARKTAHRSRLEK